MTKVRRQRELLSRLEDEMKLVRGRREEVRSRKEEFSLFEVNFLSPGFAFRWQGSWMRSRCELWRPR